MKLKIYGVNNKIRWMGQIKAIQVATVESLI